MQTESCNTGKVDPKVAAFLKKMPADNRSVEELKRTTNFVEYKKAGPPPILYPVIDVERIKITADSIPVLIFNPSHRKQAANYYRLSLRGLYWTSYTRT